MPIPSVPVGRTLGLSPDHFGDWKMWARALLSQLNIASGREIVRLPLYGHGRKPNATEDGMLIMLLDDSKGKIPVYSRDNRWMRFDNTYAMPAEEVALPESAFELSADLPTIEVVGP